MLKKEITYIDFNGVKRTEDFYFNITFTEMLNWQVQEGYGLDEEVKRISKSENMKKTIEIFEKIIDYSVGIKSEDGKRFIKNNGQVAKEFKETNAYEVLYKELATDDKKAADFINNVFPKLSEDEKKELEKKAQEIKNNQN